tara:strand:- start:714 stop:1694 length:981 start_codon:yes stop_codon:yes gene_type:complete
VGVNHCVTCANGTDALLIPLMAKNIGAGDAVFTTNFSYFATTEVISLVGATPVFVDISEQTFNINPELLEVQIKKTLNEGKLKAKAIIAVDLFGQLANYQKLESIAKKYNLFLIEDAAQSFGATYNGKRACSFGDVSATSFFPAKPLGCYGDGGAIFINDTKLANTFKSIRMHGQGKDKYDNVRVGLNSRLDTLQAVVLLNKLEIFDNELILREKIANFYSKNLKKYLKIPILEKSNKSAWAQYSLIANSEIERDLLIKHLANSNIPTAIYYKKIFSDLDIYKNIIDSKFPVSGKISKRIFSIPMHPYLTKNNLEEITNSISSFFK